MSRNIALSTLMVVIVLVAAVFFFSRSTPDRPPSPGPHKAISTARGKGPLRSCRGVRVAPHSDLASVVSKSSAGTSFCLAPGSYPVQAPIEVKPGDSFTGIAPRRDGVTIKTDSAQIIFDLNEALDVSFDHFGITGAINACPGRNCGETGRAISQGGKVTVDDMHLYGNGQNGIGGVADGLRVMRSEIDHNGAGLADGVSAGIKSVHSFSVTDSFIHDNVNNGIWCDIQCGQFIARGNVIANNTGNGIFMEISQGPALIAENIVKNNNTGGNRTAGGVNITDSRNVVVRGNVLSGNHGFAIGAWMDQRIHCGSPSTVCGFVVSGATILNNTLNGGLLVGCSLSGVDCIHNH